MGLRAFEYKLCKALLGKITVSVRQRNMSCFAATSGVTWLTAWSVSLEVQIFWQTNVLWLYNMELLNRCNGLGFWNASNLPLMSLFLPPSVDRFASAAIDLTAETLSHMIVCAVLHSLVSFWCADNYQIDIEYSITLKTISITPFIVLCTVPSMFSRKKEAQCVN